MKVVLTVYVLLGCFQVQLSVEQTQTPNNGSDILEGCSDKEFQCLSSGLCIAKHLVCNGRIECLAGEDESVCTPQFSCHLDQHRCSSGNECIAYRKVCDGIPDCNDESDEACAANPSGSICEVNQFSCSLQGPCVPLAFLCNGIGDCPNGDDEIRCELPEMKVQVPDQIFAESGDTITLSCEGIGFPPPFVTWKKDLNPLRQLSRYNFTSQNGFGVLRIHDARLEDAGYYYCESVTELYGYRIVNQSIRVEVTDTSPSVCFDHNNHVYTEGSYYYDVRPVGIGNASEAAADIIFVVDESGSMAREHRWIREEVQILDQSLKRNGVGAGERFNLFALVGFGRNTPSEILGTTLTQLTSASDFVEVSNSLMLTGTFEDGYAAIDYALENIATRPNTVKRIILVTDGDREVLRSDLSRDIIEKRLSEAGFVLDVVVNQAFIIQPLTYAIGISTQSAYLLNTSSVDLFSVLEREDVTPSSDYTFGNTFEDYVELALGLGGSVWDLNQLREGEVFTRAFTNIFTKIEVDEVLTVFSYCFECQCLSIREECSLADGVGINDCLGALTVLRSVITPEKAIVKRGDRVSFECIAYTNSDNLTVSYSWIYPPEREETVTIQNNVLTVVNAISEDNYTCIATLEGTGLVSTKTSTLFIDTRCQLSDWSYLVLGDTRLILAPPANTFSRAADIILLIDESGSMTEEHEWITMMTKLLDQALIDVNIGVSPKNRFGVVGFGNDYNTSGRVFLNSLQQEFVAADNITDFTQNLIVSGRNEDGYSAINTALSSYTFRDVAKQYILITDEDRDIIAENVTKESIKESLENAGIHLNVAVNEEFEGGNHRALGIDSNRNAYIYDPSVVSSFRVIKDFGVPVEDGAYGSTNIDYTELALGLEGAAWDLNKLRQGGGVAEAFTKAFVQVEALDIQSQLNMCMSCMCTVDGPVCDNTNFSYCMSLSAPLPGQDEEPLSVMIEGPDELLIHPTETQSLTCKVNSSAVIRWTFNGGNLPSNIHISRTGGYKSILSINSATSDNEGVYSCLVHSQSGAFSDSAFVLVTFYDPAQDLMLIISPSKPVITRGSNATISCTVNSTSAIRWTFNGGILPEINSYIIMTTNTTETATSELELVSVEESSEGYYTCIASSIERDVVNDNTIYVEIVDPTLRLLVDPDVISVTVGASVELKCKVDCICPGVIPMWSRSDNAPLSNISVITNSDNEAIEQGVEIESVLLIPKTYPQDFGRYICTAELDGISVTKEAYLSILPVEPSFMAVILGDPSPIEIQIGDYHSLVCQLNMNASSILWRFNEKLVQVQGSDPADFSEDLAPNNVIAIEVSQTLSVLTILQANLLNDGIYQCIATSDSTNELAIAAIDISIL